MVTLRHAVTLEPVPRDWFEDALRAVVDAVEELRVERKNLFAGGERVPGVRLAAGHHIGRGARYVIEDVDDAGVVASSLRVDVKAWDRSVIRLRYEGKSADLRVRGEGELRGVDSPAALKWSGDFRGAGSGARYRRGRVKAALDLRAWWGAGAGGAAPLTAELRHPLVKATVQVTMARAKDGRWKTVVSVSARGRSWARLPAAVAAVVGTIPLRRAYRRGLDDFAQEWNAQVPPMTARTSGELKAEFLHGLAADPADAEGTD